jgi:hypothetical protein
VFAALAGLKRRHLFPHGNPHSWRHGQGEGGKTHDEALVDISNFCSLLRGASWTNKNSLGVAFGASSVDVCFFSVLKMGARRISSGFPWGILISSTSSKGSSFCSASRSDFPYQMG